MIEGANHGNRNGAGFDEYSRVIHEFVRAARERKEPHRRASVAATA